MSSTYNAGLINEKIRITIDHVFSVLTRNTHGYEEQTKVKQLLLTKRQRVNSNQEYIASLSNNVAYYLVMQNGMLDYLKMTVDKKPNNYNVNEINGTLAYIQDQARQIVSEGEGQRVNLEIRKQFRSESEMIDALEFDYMFRKFQHELLVELFNVCNEIENVRNDLLEGQGTYVADTTREYLTIYTNMLVNNSKTL